MWQAWFGHRDLHFAWQAWRLRHWAGSGGALGSRLTPWSPRLLVALIRLWAGSDGTLGSRLTPWSPHVAAAVGVAGAALGDIGLHFVWQAAGVALGDIDLHFAWQAWPLRHWAGSDGALGSRLTPWSQRLLAWHARRLGTLCGRGGASLVPV